MTYRISDQAAPLANLRVNTGAEVAGSHPTMQANTQAVCDAHNAAIDLMLGEGAYATAWEQLPVDAAGNPVQFDPGPFAVAIDSICIELRSKQSPHTPADAEMIRHRVGLVAGLDANHPVAQHWRVLQARSYPPEQVVSWPELEALVPEA